MPYFHFDDLIDKYSSDFTLITKGEGYYNDMGDWVQGEPTKTEMKGAIIGYKEEKIYRSEGKLTSQDKALYMLEPIDGALAGAEVIYNGEKYHVESIQDKDNAKFTGVFSYLLKWVSAFDGGDSIAGT